MDIDKIKRRFHFNQQFDSPNITTVDQDLTD